MGELMFQPPQTPIKLRSDGRHFFVKLGDRESMYSVAESRLSTLEAPTFEISKYSRIYQ